jgi:arylsulfatase A-like enzyme
VGERPNILLICTDQQSSTAMSCAGNDELSTPAMDHLAAGGTRFTRAYCTQPLCAPQRASCMTGCLPHRAGVIDNRGPLADGLVERSLPRLLGAAGYRCGLAGKWHVPGVTPQQAGFEVLCGSRDDEIPVASAEFLREAGDEPFFLFASYTNPHDICEAARSQGLPQGPVPEPPPIGDCPNLPANFADPPYAPDILGMTRQANPRIYPTASFTPDDWRRLRWQYFRLVEKVDAEVGRLLQALDDTGRAQNTVVLFTSDHGDGAGAHHWNQKTAFWEESIRVPLIVRGPGVAAGGTTPLLGSTGVDLLPTLCDIAGVDSPEGIDGVSLWPALTAGAGPATERDGVVVQTSVGLGEGPGGPAVGRSLIGRRYKYSLYALGRYREQLVDLQDDPGEMVNLAVETRHARLLDECRAALRAHCDAVGDTAGARLIP